MKNKKSDYRILLYGDNAVIALALKDLLLKINQTLAIEHAYPCDFVQITHNYDMVIGLPSYDAVYLAKQLITISKSHLIESGKILLIHNAASFPIKFLGIADLYSIDAKSSVRELMGYLRNAITGKGTTLRDKAVSMKNLTTYQESILALLSLGIKSATVGRMLNIRGKGIYYHTAVIQSKLEVSAGQLKFLLNILAGLDESYSSNVPAIPFK
jgi:DNA-binding CsgD family transcriptional regulator